MNDQKLEEIEIKSSRGGSYTAVLLPLKTPNGAFCRGCDEPIRFSRTRRGSQIPVSQNGLGEWVAHFSVCAHGEKCRRILSQNQ